MTVALSRLEATAIRLREDCAETMLCHRTLLALLKDHKAELLAALSGKINRWRVTHADGRITEHSSRGLTRSRRWNWPGALVSLCAPSLSG